MLGLEAAVLSVCAWTKGKFSPQLHTKKRGQQVNAIIFVV
jgi:hypothetical protein